MVIFQFAMLVYQRVCRRHEEKGSELSDPSKITSKKNVFEATKMRIIAGGESGKAAWLPSKRGRIND